MPIVRTVLGDVDATEIGVTSIHEHLFVDGRLHFEDASETPTIPELDPDTATTIAVLGVLHRNPKVLRDNLVLNDVELAIEEVGWFRRAGGDCIVDQTSVGIGRDVSGLRKVAEATGVKIVAATGYYVEASLSEAVVDLPETALADRMIRDVTEGIEGSVVRAGVIGEIGTTTLTAWEQKLLRASARASIETGATIAVHTAMGRRLGLEIVDILMSVGARPDRVIIGHMDENLVELGPAPTLAHLDYHRRVLNRGVWISYDTFGSEWYLDRAGRLEPRDTERAAGVTTLIGEGYADQLLIGQDIWTKHSLKRYGGWGYDHLVRVVPVMLARLGVAADAVQGLLVENPRRALALAPR